jgi:molybdenum cofactor guanylyltransferase
MTTASGAIGLILAGGQARRMGGADKALLVLGGMTLVERSVRRARAQLGEVLINANGDPARFGPLGCAVLPDRIGDFQGPLAGILAGLEWLRAHRPGARWLASFACDCPFFPPDLVARLIAAAESAHVPIALAASAGRHHPVFAVWRTDLNADSESILRDGISRKMDDFIARFPSTRVEFETAAVDPFFNINTPDELARAEALIAAGKTG